MHFSYLVLAEHVAFGDAEEQRVGDLTCGTSHQHTDRFGLKGEETQNSNNKNMHATRHEK